MIDRDKFIGSNIGSLIEIKQIQRMNFATTLGLTMHEWFSFEHGIAPIPKAMLDRICEILNVSTEFVTYFNVKELLNEKYIKLYSNLYDRDDLFQLMLKLCKVKRKDLNFVVEEIDNILKYC